MAPAALLASILIPFGMVFMAPPKRDCGAVPEVNQQVVGFVKSKINQRVGRGECWDLAAQALNSAGASWDGRYGFGREVHADKECIFPGDIVQFDGVKVRYQRGTYFYEETMDKHTAVIYEVRGETSFVVAEQNTSGGGRKVTLNPLDLKSIVKGQCRLYRPIKERTVKD